uniref:Uncharacterized protein n=1 Tax=Arundo donax TaxID=35708 RepID=A0A0A9H9E3_ARUDO
MKGEAARRKARSRAGSQTLIAMAGPDRIGGARAFVLLCGVSPGPGCAGTSSS